jgi:hypothetical protein
MRYKGGENDLYDVFKNDLFDENPCLKVEFSKTMDQNMVEKETFNQLQRGFSQLQKHCIELEIEKQHKEECLQNCKPCLNPELPDLNEYFLINNLKTQLQDKDSTINNLKNQIKMYEQRNDAKWNHDTYETKCNMAKLRMENETLKVKCKELCESLKVINAENINLTTPQFTGSCPKIPGEHIVPSYVSKSQMSLNLSKPSILGKPVLKTVGHQTTIRQPNAFISERLKFSKTRCVSQVDKKRDLTKSVRSKPTIHKSNGLKPVKPLRHRPRKFDHRSTHHKNVTMHETTYRLRSSLLWIPTGRTFVMNGHKWSHVCTIDTGFTKGLHNRATKTCMWRPKTLTSPTTRDMSTHM